MISNILTRIFGSRNERLLKQFAQVRKLVKGLGTGSKAMKRLAARMPP